MSTAREHAVTASELLDSEARLEERLRNMTPDEHLQLVATGHVTTLNADRRFTITLAIAHALAALGMSATEAEDATEPVPPGRREFG